MTRTLQYHGQPLRMLRAPGFCLLERRYEGRSSLPSHGHADAHLCLVLEGLYEEQIGSDFAQRLPSSLIYYAPNLEHSESHYTPGRHFLINVNAGWLADQGLQLSTTIAQRSHGPAVRLAIKLYEMMVSNSHLDATEVLRRLLALLVEPETPRGPRFAWIHTITRQLREDLHCTSLVELAKIVRLHPSHVARSFHTSVGCSIGAYRRRLQVERACYAITHGSEPLLSIALAAGYSDQSQMCREVKRATGSAPMELRETGKRKRPGG